MTHPLEEAAHLRKMAAEKLDKYGDPPTDGRPSIGVLFGLHPILFAVLHQTEAAALERGYLRGRAMAAYDVRMGLDDIEGNGSIHYDSDTEPPPSFLVKKAENLARGTVH